MVRRIIRKLKSVCRGAPSGLILMYHRVNEAAIDPWQLCVSPDHFAEHLQVLQKFRCVPLSAIGNQDRRGRDVAITFDDGYADNLHNAVPCLDRYGAPATFFITTGTLGGERLFWWDELADLLLGGDSPAAISCTLESAGHRWLLDDAVSRGQSELERFKSIYALLQPMDGCARDRVIAEIAAQCPAKMKFRPEARQLTQDEVLKLASHPLAEVGAHTVTHPRLSSCTPSRQWIEISESRKFLEDLLGRTVSSFAYPYGGDQHVNSTSTLMVQRAGYARACSTRPGPVFRDTDSFRLNRLLVPDIDGTAFENLLQSVGYVT